MPPVYEHIVVVGASLAGLRAAEALRREGHQGAITLIGDEPVAPYDRPPLSKQVLAADWDADRVMLSDAEKLAEVNIALRTGARASALDLETRTLTLADGDTVSFDGLIIATGARTRNLPGGDDLAGVFTLRTLDDSLALREAFQAKPTRVVVCGAGFIGAEVASTARGHGLDVTMVEMAPVPLERIVGAEMGQVCADIHTDAGVDLRLGVGVDALLSEDGRVTGVKLTDGSTVDAEVVVVGIGVIPNIEWLEGSGLTLDNGIVCDETCLAAPGVVAAGDVARWPNQRFGGEMMRVEHWDNAVEQGVHAARRLLQDDADAQPYTPVPWFWSDQYDRKIQLAGRTRPDDETRIVTGSVEERRFATAYGRDGKLVGIFAFNRPRHVMQYRGLINDGATWDEAMAFADEQAAKAAEAAK